MASGRIRDEDVALVRERARIDEVVSAHVALRPAGGGNLKGLCPFHDEKSPSFNVRPDRGFFHCFGCQEGGDVITFVEKIEGVGFGQAVERLATRYGVDLHYIDDGSPAPRRESGNRHRLVEANRAAAEFYQSTLTSPEAVVGRQFLSERGFDEDAARHFGVGFAPRDGDALYKHLRQKGFAETELVTAGLVATSGRGPYDRFRGRLLWPIRELSGDVVGFGARRLFDDDRIEAKYLNTPETPIYKKSQLLYGADLARKEIGRALQAVVVEGYTDVMACHLSGVGTAVATCGTAFGEEHARVLRRLLLDNDQFRGEVVFTFDGDEAGQKAALRAFAGDQQFVGQTYVAIEPEGRDPCELRMAEGPEAVCELVARRIPLYRFVLSNVMGRFDLDRADGRIDAVREAAKLVASVRDNGKVEAFAREVAMFVGNAVEPNDVLAEVRRARGRQGGGAARGQRPQSAPETEVGSERQRTQMPDPREPRFSIERDVLKVALQVPSALASTWDAIEADDFTHEWYRELYNAIVVIGGPPLATPEAVTAKVLHDEVRTLVSALSVESLPSTGSPDARYADELATRLRELTAMRRISEVKARLQRMNPLTHQGEYNKLFGELVALESHRRALREKAIGAA